MWSYTSHAPNDSTTTSGCGREAAGDVRGAVLHGGTPSWCVSTPFTYRSPGSTPQPMMAASVSCSPGGFGTP